MGSPSFPNARVAGFLMLGLGFTTSMDKEVSTLEERERKTRKEEHERWNNIQISGGRCLSIAVEWGERVEEQSHIECACARRHLPPRRSEGVEAEREQEETQCVISHIFAFR